MCSIFRNLPNKKKNLISYESKISKKLKKREIKEICLLKDSHWKFGIKSQINWYNINVKDHDIHNLLYIKSKLIGYTFLRRRSYKIGYTKKEKKYLLFDALVIDKKYRKKKYSDLLMKFNNKIIKKKGIFSFLVCKKELINFYEKYDWKKLNKKSIKLLDHTFRSNGMIYNNKKKYKKYVFYVNK